MARGAVVLAVMLCTALGAVTTGASAQILQPTTTTSPPQNPSTTSTTTPDKQPKLVGGGGDDPNGTANGVIPPGYAKIIASVKRSKANNTKDLMAALQPLVEKGMAPAQAAVFGFGRFPVGGVANFTDDWLNPRFSGAFHLHEGTDIFAATGTPVRSPVDGVLRHATGGLGGTAAYVKTVEGHEVYFAHLASYSELKPGAAVKVGDVLGYVGDTGNARGGAAHLHFEIHPKGKGPVNPKPYLDQWVAQALASAPTLVAAFLGSVTPTAAPTVPEVLPAAVQKIQPPRAQLAWASSANPTGGALRLAEVEATVAALQVDWNKRARDAEAERKAFVAADNAAKAMLRPLTPRGLLDVLALR
ncbi:MAG: M23 family metallopeptidase [Acidimicrobiales bacterium]|nr:M23 family metallopeptidase [Acidimicrobiales bacterium]